MPGNLPGCLRVVCCLKVPSRGTSSCADHVSVLCRAFACLVSQAPDGEVNSRPLPRPPVLASEQPPTTASLTSRPAYAVRHHVGGLQRAVMNGRNCQAGRQLSQEAPYPATPSVPRRALVANSSQNSQKTNVTVACDMPLAPGSEPFAGRVTLCREPASSAASKRGHIQGTAKVQQLKAAGKYCDECWQPAYFVRIGLG